MFSFHKPKIYRSIQGCCICRAKSSSSRFTDSKRYENDFGKCFEILERRAGEICNACVLLVKRWKKLPTGSNRNWHHVVDARAGPGTKSMNKIKNKAKLEEKLLKKKHKHKHKKPKIIKTQSPGSLSDDVNDECMSDRSSRNSYIDSEASDDENGSSSTRSKTSGSKHRKNPNPARFSSFLDLTYWKKTEVCCGIIFKGANGEVMVDTSLLRPCTTCKPKPSAAPKQTVSTAASLEPATSSTHPSGASLSSLAAAAESCSSSLEESSMGSLSEPSTPSGTQPPTPAEAAMAPAVSSPPHHTSAEVALASAVLDLSVPKVSRSSAASPTLTSAHHGFEATEIMEVGLTNLSTEQGLSPLEQQPSRIIEMEV